MTELGTISEKSKKLWIIIIIIIIIILIKRRDNFPKTLESKSMINIQTERLCNMTWYRYSDN